MAAPILLTSLTPREAIADAMYRAVTALDTANRELFDSAVTQDVVLDMNGDVTNGLKALHDGLWDFIANLDTTHFITNMRVEVQDGASTASGTASALAQHYRPGQGREPGATRLLGGGLYTFDVVRDDTDGRWRLKYWKLQSVWMEGDMGVMARP